MNVSICFSGLDLLFRVCAPGGLQHRRKVSIMKYCTCRVAYNVLGILFLQCSLIDKAEWRIHEGRVAELLPNLKDAVNDADDLLDEFRWYELKMEVEGNASHSAFIDFYKTTVQGSFNKVNDIQERLNSISGQLEKMGLYGVTPGFDKSVRPDTTPFPNEKKIFGRDKDQKEVMGFLGVPQSKGRACSKRKRASSAVNASTSTTAQNQVNKSRISAIPVLPIVGMGGVGKTTLAQHICNHQQVKDYFELIIWICADDFDVKRLIKDAIQCASGKQTTVDNLASLQRALSECVSSRRFLIVVDDVWDDALKENEQRWKGFYDSLTNVVQGSMMLVTTRFPDVADRVRTMEPFPLAGLKEDVFWDFFKLCAFGSESSENDPELERIAKSIVPKLKGSPLAAKTLGRLLGMNLHTAHWNNILESELWKLKQEKTDILPALRLSYIYLPFHLKRCFSFCAVYAKDHKFEKGRLAEIWVAEGFVEPQGNTPLEYIGLQYFEDLVNRSFFQKVRGAYVIHDLLHDMAKLVSDHDCFTIKNMRDFQMVPQNVRHLYILPSIDLITTKLSSLSKHTKLRTLICDKSLGKQAAAIMDHWCSELQRLRVIFWASSNELPDSIGNLKHLRYLEISKACPFKSPSAFRSLYNLQRLYAEECNLKSLSGGFSKLISLRGFKSQGFQYYAGSEQKIDATNQFEMKIFKNLNQFDGHMNIWNLGSSSNHAADFKLNDKKYLRRLTLQWSRPFFPVKGVTEVLQVLQPPTSLKSLVLKDYPDGSLPNWFQPRINLNETPAVLVDNNNDEIGTLSALEELAILRCPYLRSVQQFLRPAYVPAIKKLSIVDCNELVSLPTETFGDFHSLEILDLHGCPDIRSTSLVAHSLKKLLLGSSRNLTDNIQCCSLTEFYLSCDYVTTIQPQMWNLPALQKLHISNCRSLTTVGQGQPPIRAFESLTLLIINNSCSLIFLLFRDVWIFARCSLLIKCLLLQMQLTIE
ncbi:Disease resistance protein RGA2 [Triticum urartu]|uniref:Disease resistance protein RGA2 n=1 Tax=Triticum urartu TaxID=4572 RepID=M7ZYM6_TRIUA|nr:Disease resistance protein RGA2 [Triticum urartu]